MTIKDLPRDEVSVPSRNAPERAIGIASVGRRVPSDPVPPGLILDLEEAFPVLEALEDARLALREVRAMPGLQDELATVIRVVHVRLGSDEGGVQ
jgi:hypothetical protein